MLILDKMKNTARGGQQSWPDDLLCLRIQKIDEVLGKFASVDRFLNDLVAKNCGPCNGADWLFSLNDLN